MLPWILWLAAMSALSGSAFAGCPEGSIQFIPAPATTSTLARRDTSGTGPLGGAGQARYDLVAGTQYAFASVAPDENLGMAITTTDEYELVGVPGPAPISFHARLRLPGYLLTYCDPLFATSHVSVWSYLEEEGTGQRDATRLDGRIVCPDGTKDPFDHTLDLSVAHAVGVPFPLDLQTAAGAVFGEASIQGVLSFVLPPGYSIQSCQGYAGSGSVPTTSTTWGAIKARYR